ncbi:hypothetical protein LTR84_005339 [Exophiala bonariae]|uniref:Rhodopsin domain-containing protein n=1 Tax=Exophiala bonariae TaxID=1690606 RepID=A0AAV9N3V6_9EURO|nr:hypothetical protein LTR84_005339 [Exophiala bonariae]
MLATAFLLAQCATSIAAVDFGYGRPLETLERHQAARALKCFFLVQIFYKLTINCTKLSILFLYLRIFIDRLWFVRGCWCLIVLVLCACIGFTASTLVQCSPISSAWQPWSTERSCVNIFGLWYSNAIYNILTDLIIVLMVPPVIFTLKLPMRQKLALTGIFGLGTIVCAASISRLTTLYSSAYGTDATAGSLISTIWTTIEAGLGIICANLPMLRTPIQHFFPRLFPSTSGTNRLSSRGVSLPCRSSHSTTNVCHSEAPQTTVYPAELEGGSKPGTHMYETSATANTIIYPRDEAFWRPCLDTLPENRDFELHTEPNFQTIGLSSHHEQVPEEDWYKYQHKVW